jgi:hypothetical protein
MSKPHARRAPPALAHVPMAVRRSQLHESTELKLANLLERRATLARRHAAALALPRTIATARQVVDLESEDADLRRQIAGARASLAPMRREHVAALVEWRAKVALQAVAAIEDLGEALAEIETARRHIGEAGGTVLQIEAPDLRRLQVNLGEVFRPTSSRGRP